MSLPSLRPFLLAALIAVAAVASHAAAQEPTCAGFDRPIVFAELDYDSVNILTAIARFLLEEGFGCATDSIPGTTLPLLQGSVRGDIDVTMEIWTDNTPDFWREALTQGRVRELQPVFDDAAQGFFVPRYLVEGDTARGIAAAAPDLRSVADLPRYAALFRDPEQPDKGRLYNCVIGWFCEGINNVKFHVYGLDDHFTNFRAGTGIALETTMEAAYARGEPWLGYYWEPTGILGRLDMLRLEEPPYSDACFEHMLAHVDTPERATEACEYAVVVAVVGLGSRFASTVPQPIEAVLDAMYVPTATINRLLAHMAETGADTTAAARHFLETEGERWASWLDGVDPGVRERIDAALR